MAPTEVLARQHYESFVKGFEKAGLDIRVELLVGSMTAKQKKGSICKDCRWNCRNNSRNACVDTGKG